MYYLEMYETAVPMIFKANRAEYIESMTVAIIIDSF